MSQKTNQDLSLKELCNILSVSNATLHNWIRLGKVKPDYKIKKTFFFTQQNVDKIMKKIQSASNNLLKTRRNKKYISGTALYKNYLTETNQNLKTINFIREYLAENGLCDDTDLLNLILAECGLQLLVKSNKINSGHSKNCLEQYLKTKIDPEIFSVLIDEFISDKKKALSIISNNKEVFDKEYYYTKNEDILGLIYLSCSNSGSRKSAGAYYTPSKTVKKLIQHTKITNNPSDKILDPCCGSGNFLLQLDDNINPSQIYGNDIDKTSIALTRLNMAIKYNIDDISLLYKNFTNKDFLYEYEDNDFKYIIGNPPWGFDFKDTTFLKQNYQSAQTKNIESYDLFTEKSLTLLKNNGILSFVVPEAILNVKSHKKIRELILKENSVKYLEFLGDVFDKVQCPSIIIKILHNNKPFSTKGLTIQKGDNIFTIRKERKITSDNFDFLTNDAEYEILEKILNTSNALFLKDNAVFSLGIVTGDNKKYISHTKTVTNEVIIKGSDISQYKITHNNNYIEFNPDKFQQVAPAENYRADEKLVYKFISDNLVFAYDNQKRLTLNSCNVLIPKISGLNIKYIMAVLNSRMSQFVYKNKFNSLKVLRSHIEKIPVPVCDDTIQSKVIKLADKMMLTTDFREFKHAYDETDKILSELYHLTPGEYRQLKKKIL